MSKAGLRKGDIVAACTTAKEGSSRKRTIAEVMGRSMWMAGPVQVEAGPALQEQEDGQGTASTIKYFGYSQPDKQTGTFAWEDKLRYTHEEHVTKGRELERCGSVTVELARNMGRHGLCAFSRLHYVDLNNMFIVPVCHALLYGVTKDFLKSFLANGFPGNGWKCTRYAKKTMSSRSTSITLTSEFSRPYRDVVHHLGSYTMEEMMAFLLTYWEFVFLPFTHPRDRRRTPVMGDGPKEAWVHLSIAARHYLVWSTAQDPEEFESKANRACSALQRYAVLAEKNFPHLCTSNLHMLVCRLRAQESAWGQVSKDLELWVEREIREVKSGYQQGAQSGCPELCFANRWAARTGTRDAMSSLQESTNDATKSGTVPSALRDFCGQDDANVPGQTSSSSIHPACYKSVYMIGGGVLIGHDDRETLLKACQHTHVQGILDATTINLLESQQATIRVFRQAAIKTPTGANVVSSKAYNR